MLMGQANPIFLWLNPYPNDRPQPTMVSICGVAVIIEKE